MCTERESKLFIDTINQIPVKEPIKVSLEVPYISFIEEDFPQKDRHTSRKHNASKKRKKEHDRNSKVRGYQRSYDMYVSGIDKNGRTFKTRSIDSKATFDEKDFFKRDEAITETKTKDINWSEVFEFCYDMSDLIINLNCFKTNGIFLSEETEAEILNKAATKDANKKRRNQIYSERKIVGYKVITYTCYEEENMGNFPTKELALEYANMLNEKGYDAEVAPIKMFTKEQARELINLG